MDSRYILAPLPATVVIPRNPWPAAPILFGESFGHPLFDLLVGISFADIQFLEPGVNLFLEIEFGHDIVQRDIFRQRRHEIDDLLFDPGHINSSLVPLLYFNGNELANECIMS